MTLSTNIYALDPVSPHELFRFCQALMTKYDEPTHRPPEQQSCSDEPLHGIWELPGAWSISNSIGQDLPAILDIKYRPDAPLRTPEQAAEHENDCDEDCDRQHHSRACWLDIDFDTAYGAHFSNGMGCGDLHAALVSQVGQWLDARSVRWEWRNEFTGDVHGGDERYERLIDLCRGGLEAEAWFRTMVLPAIAAGVLGEER